MNFEDEQRFIFPENVLKDSDNYNKYYILSDKTKRDEYFFIQNEDYCQDIFGMLEL